MTFILSLIPFTEERRQWKEQQEEEELRRLRDQYNEEIVSLMKLEEDNGLLTEDKEKSYMYGDLHLVGDIMGYGGDNSNQNQIKTLKEAINNVLVHKKEVLNELWVNNYRKLRKEIEAMPQYRIWREEVLKKFGRKCVVCGSTENIEVDHRYESFYSIVKRHGITNTVQAYECAALWDVNNGAPLCRLHHDQTKSSVHHRGNNRE